MPRQWQRAGTRYEERHWYGRGQGWRHPDARQIRQQDAQRGWHARQTRWQGAQRGSQVVALEGARVQVAPAPGKMQQEALLCWFAEVMQREVLLCQFVEMQRRVLLTVLPWLLTRLAGSASRQEGDHCQLLARRQYQFQSRLCQARRGSPTYASARKERARVMAGRGWSKPSKRRSKCGGRGGTRGCGKTTLKPIMTGQQEDCWLPSAVRLCSSQSTAQGRGAEVGSG